MAPSGAAYSRLFEHRSGRVIALCRLVMAVVFAIALWLDPMQPTRTDVFGLEVLLGYLGLAVALTAVAWRSWWYDHLAAAPVFAIDVGVFLLAVFYTENSSSDFVSPFLSFFAFLMLAAIARWGWRVTAWLAAAISIAFVILGARLHETGVVLDLFRFGRRIAYMVLMALVLVWFGSQRRATARPRFVLPDGQPASIPEDAIAFARAASGARSAALAWIDEEEPRAVVASDGPSGQSRSVLPPDSLSGQDMGEALLFDRRRRRQLVLKGNGRILARKGSEPPGAVQSLGFEEGILVPLSGATGHGLLVLSGINGMSADHAPFCLEIGREIALAFDREHYAAVANDATVMRLRSSIARDLHDSVAQSLAGASFRLAALRNIIADGRDPLDELDSIRGGISGEQENVREIIKRLREAEIAPGDHSLALELGKLADQLARYWNVEIALGKADASISASAPLIYEIQQLVREAVANAVRHGAATTIGVDLSRRRGQMALAVTDNGQGFPGGAEAELPRSLTERLAALGGTLVISSRPGETRIVMTIPVRGRE